jgi:ribosomal protein S6--L-glutamate ligase
MVKKRSTRRSNLPLITVGWEEWVSLPDLNLPAIKAKVDTGAKTSSLHAFSIEPYGENDERRVRFIMQPDPEHPDIEVVCTAPLIDIREITSSNGQTEERCIIETELRLGEHISRIEVSLTNRETMRYKMLLGRTAMQGSMQVQPDLSCINGMMDYTAYHQMDDETEPVRHLKIGILTQEPENYTSQRLVSVAEGRGHMVQLIPTSRCYLKINENKPEVHLKGQPLEGFDVIIPRIGASMTFYGMAVVRQFEMMGIYCLNSSEAIGRSRDKLHAHQLLSRKTIAMPTTCIAHSPHDTNEIISLTGGAPLILKLLEGTQGKGVVLAETSKAAESVIQAFKGLKANILVQEFVEEANGEDIRCLVVGNRCVGAMKRCAKEGDFRSNLHQGGQAQKVKITVEEKEVAIKAAKAIGLSVAGVDILRSNSGPKVLEVNSSPGLEGIEKTSTKDIASYIIEHAERQVHARRLKKKTP